MNSKQRLKPPSPTAARSEIMRAVKSQNTAPEKIVRSFLHRNGFRFRINVSKLPGKPDIVLPKYHTVIRIMGCFWHGHHCKRGGRIPKNNRSYWQSKIEKNKKRDKDQKHLLGKQGWRIIDVWECKLKSDRYLQRLAKMLSSKN